MAASEPKRDSDLVKQFCSIVENYDLEIARNALEASGGDLDLAVMMYVDSEIPGTSNAQGSPCRDGGLADVEPEVRKPIPQKHDRLIESDQHIDVITNRSLLRRPNASITVFEPFRDLDNPQPSTCLDPTSQKLADLFRPPTEIMHRGSLQSALEEARQSCKWLMVNIQNCEEFSCQVLNRDIWKDITIKELIQRKFIFWQEYSNTVEGKHFIRYYNITTWPYVVILHPVNGEKQQEYTYIKLPNFLQELKSFVLTYPYPDGIIKTGTGDNSADKTQSKTIYDDDEEAQMAAAIRASLTETSSSPVFTYDDSDSNHDSDDNVMQLSPDTRKTTPKKKCPRYAKSHCVKNKNLIMNGSRSECHSQDEPKQKQPRLSESNSSSKESQTSLTGVKSWKELIQPGEDVHILLRLPDQTRQQVKLTENTPLNALFVYCEELGYTLTKYELIANFPRRQISEFPPNQILSEVSIKRQETLYVQLR